MCIYLSKLWLQIFKDHILRVVAQNRTFLFIIIRCLGGFLAAFVAWSGSTCKWKLCKITVSHSFKKWNFYAPMLPKILFTFVHLHLPSACYSIRHWPIVHLLPIKCNVFKARKMFYKVNNYSLSRL